MEARVVAALVIVAVCATAAAIGLAIYLPRRRREKLRRRGIKSYKSQRSSSDRRLAG